MSSEIFSPINKSFTTLDVERAKHFIVKDEQETLSDFVRKKIRDKGLSYRDVAQRSGNEISAATIGQIINANQGQLKTATVIALARGLGEPVELLFKLAYGEFPAGSGGFKESKFGQLYELYSKLSDAEQEKLEATLEMLKLYIEDRIRRIYSSPPLLGIAAHPVPPEIARERFKQARNVRASKKR